MHKQINQLRAGLMAQFPERKDVILVNRRNAHALASRRVRMDRAMCDGVSPKAWISSS